jgi:hypothetical protein
MQRQNICGRGIYLEFQHVGDYVKLFAIDAETNIEASIVGTPRITQQQLTRLAVRKLEYVMEKRRLAGDTSRTVVLLCEHEFIKSAENEREPRY